MSAANNGGPAFPIADDQMVHAVAAAAVLGITDQSERDKVYIETRAKVGTGMSLRDYFAGAALTTALGYEKADIAMWSPSDFARHAYQVADAMLAEHAR